MKHPRTKEALLGDTLAVAMEPTFFDLEHVPIDPKAIVEMAARRHANTLRLGVYSHQGKAYYPSRIAPHAPGLESRDLFREFLSACGESGLALAAYVNSTTDTDTLAEHPDWVMQFHGKPRRIGLGTTDLDLYWSCPNSPYLDYVRSILIEIAEEYDPPIVYIDNFGLEPGCECRFCRDAFRLASGADLPKTADWDDPHWQTYRRWIRERNLALAKRLIEPVRTLRPGTPVVFNWGEFHSATGLQNPEAVRALGREIADNIHAESAVRFHGESFAHVNEQCLFGRAMGLPVWTWVEYPLMPWFYVSAPPAEVKIKAAKVLANGGRPMVFTVTRAPDGDERGLEGFADVFGLASRFPEYFNHTEHVTFLAVLHSSQTLENTCRGDPACFEECKNEFLGALALARHAHLPADIVLERHLKESELSRYRVLLLPNAAALSAEQCAAIRSFVKAGGGLLATFESSLYDEEGKRRKDFALADVFGAGYEREIRRQNEHRSTGYSVMEKEHPASKSFAPGFRLAAGGRHLGVREHGHAVRLGTILTRCRYFGDYPGPPTGYPALVAQEFGRGRVLYIPAQFGWTYAQFGFPDYLTLFSDAVEWLSQGEVPVRTTLPDTVELTLARNAEGARILHLVNCTFDPTRPVSVVGPVLDAEMGVRMPKAGKVRARALVSGLELPFRMAKGMATFRLPRLDEYEVIVLEQAT
ncbi:MAG: alpha-amylase family protein [Planctomycetota bacterium]